MYPGTSKHVYSGGVAIVGSTICAQTCQFLMQKAIRAPETGWGRCRAPSGPFWTSRPIFKAYSSRAIDLQHLFCDPGAPWHFETRIESRCHRISRISVYLCPNLSISETKRHPRPKKRLGVDVGRPDRNTGPGEVQLSVFLFGFVLQRACRHARQSPPPPPTHSPIW